MYPIWLVAVLFLVGACTGMMIVAILVWLRNRDNSRNNHRHQTRARLVMFGSDAGVVK